MSEQIIKLWEDAGFEIKSCTKEKFEVYKQWTEKFNEYKINTEAEVIIDREYLYISGNFPNEYRQLLIKTLKVLEVQDE